MINVENGQTSLPGDGSCLVQMVLFIIALFVGLAIAINAAVIEPMLRGLPPVIDHVIWISLLALFIALLIMWSIAVKKNMAKLIEGRS